MTITKNFIISELKGKYYTGYKKTAPILSFIGILFLFFGAIISNSGAVMPSLLFFITGTICTYFGIKRALSIKQNYSKIQNERFSIKRCVCTGVDLMKDSDGDGYCIKFENGDSFVVGEHEYKRKPIYTSDVFYLLYLEGYKNAGAFYRASEWSIDNELEAFIS